jgi:fructokinase
LRVGVDLGGTKIEAVVLDGDSAVIARQRMPTPRDSYHAILDTITALIAAVEQEVGATSLPVGIGTPGSLSPRTGRLRNSNTVVMNGQPFVDDIQQRLGRQVRIANDANCLTLSEASDGAAAGCSVVFGVILGTGCGGGVVIDGKLRAGVNGIGGEWGHNPLPWPDPEDPQESPGHDCWCGRRGCMETYLSGTGLALQHRHTTGEQVAGRDVIERADAGDAAALASRERYANRLARGLSSIINLLDPDAIVLGGGLSNVDWLYARVPELWQQWVFSDVIQTRLLRARYGDSSGVRGAAWLWPKR